MPTMTHTKAQNKAWRAGQLTRRPGESRLSSLQRWFREGHVTSGAYTPSFLKRGLQYSKPLPLPANRGGGQR